MFVPGAAAVTDAMRARFAQADVVLFDGTVFTDDEMQRTGTGTKTGRRMGHMPIDGESGGLQALAGRRLAATSCISTTPIRSRSMAPPTRRSRGRRNAGGRGRHGDHHLKLLSPEKLEAALRDIGDPHYHRLHPFHGLLHGGKCTKGQVRPRRSIVTITKQ